MERKGIFFRAAAQTEEIARKGKMDIDCCVGPIISRLRGGGHTL
jgi:hypothetical protein